MRDFVRPKNVQPEVDETFRQIQGTLKRSQVPIIKDKRNLQAIPEGTSAYFVDAGVVYRYTKLQGKLIREAIDNVPRASRVNNINVRRVVVGTQQTEYKEYVQSNPPGENFVAEYYGSVADRNSGTQLPENQRPTDLTFDPATPAQTEGTHIVTITYTVPTNGADLVFVEVYIE